ncbi:MAG TPA: chemotaxis response regulator protein-glutamate methylesterase [Firmicutes bacterium]|nr:chemotaxis response regulator protein-glutamate methylesterase [Candidatus Fermentithermobacillaceae bacterium]
MTPVRVLVCDDSFLARHIVKKSFEGDARFSIVGEAVDGVEAVEKVLELDPDVVILDVEMPRMSGLEALKQIMECRPTPVLMFSSRTQKGARTTIEALSLGAVDFLPKPDGGPLALSRVSEELVSKTLAVARARVRMGKVRKTMAAKSPTGEPPESLVLLGASTGGPQALEEIMAGIDPGVSGIIVQHMPAGFTSSLARRLDSVSKLRVEEAFDGQQLEKGKVIVAKGGYHLRLSSPTAVFLDDGSPVHGVRPSVDVAIEDASRFWGPKLIIAILTGMGFDGARGARTAKKAGARVLVQDESTSVVWGMPRATMELGSADVVLPIEAIAPAINTLVKELESR